MSRSLRSSRLLQRGGTIAGAATAVVLGCSGLALGATTHDVVNTNVTAPVQAVTTTVSGLAPTPQPQSAPAPSLPAPVSAVVSPVVKTATTTVHALTSPTDVPPVAPPVAPAPKAKPAATGRQTIVYPNRVHSAAVSNPLTSRALSGEASAANLSAANDMALTQHTASPVAPQLAPADPSATGPLANMPDLARHGLPMAFVLAGAAILACLAAGHLGLWYERRNGLA